MEDNSNNKVPVNLNKGNDNIPTWRLFLIVWLICYLVSTMIVFNGNSSDTSLDNYLKTFDWSNYTYQEATKNTTYKCLSYHPIFDEEGTKRYEVLFSDMLSHLTFNAIVDAKEVDTLHNIEKGAKYEGSITYLYIYEIFDGYIDKNSQVNEEEAIIRLINGDSIVSQYGRVSGVSFMYSKGVTEISRSKAEEKLEKYRLSVIDLKV